MTRNVETVIVGAGASGLMLASLLPPSSALLLEHQADIGAKIAVSGGGKCNITNRTLNAGYYRGDPVFIRNVIERFNNDELLRWLLHKGLDFTLRNNTQYFCRHSARELVELFRRTVRKQQLITRVKVLDATKENGRFVAITNQGRFICRNLVVASGGLSYPKLGASDIGYRIAKKFGHTVVKTSPALVGLTLQPEYEFFKELSGVSTPVNFKYFDKTFSGSMLMTHRGISGPVVLNASLFWEKGHLITDFLPTFPYYTYDQSLTFKSFPLPKRLQKALVRRITHDFGRLTPVEFVKRMKNYHITPAGTFGYTKAEVTRGGVATDELDAKTMMSRKVDGLYFVGEVTDVTGMLGGYNFQWAFSSAFIAARQLSKKGKKC